MAAGNGYTTGIRQGLNDKGISNDRITYNPNSGVMVDGNSFYKPEKVYSGTSYTSPTNFNNAWNSYQQTQQKQQPQNTQVNQQQPQQQPQQFNYNAYANNSGINNNPYTSQADDLINQLMNYSKNQQSFDPYSTSSYQAAQAQADKRAYQGARNAQESYGSANFGRSTGLGERVANINNESTEYLMTQVLPQIEAQEQARRQQEFNNMISSLSPLMNQQGRADNLVQQDIENRRADGVITGNYVNQEASALINELLNLKQNTESDWRTLTPEQRAGNTAQADVYRNQLAAMGYNSDLFGADVRSDKASTNRSLANRTLAGQELDFNRETDQRNFDYQERRDTVEDKKWYDQYGITLAEVTGYMPDGTPTSAQQQLELNNFWMVADQTGTIPQELAQLYGLKAGTPTRAAKEFAAQLAIQQQNANTSAYSARASAANAAANTQLSRDKFNYDKDQDAKKGSSSGGGSSKDPKYNYKNDPVFFKAMQTASNIANPQQALNELKENADEFYETFGYEGYNQLLKVTEDRIAAERKAAEKFNNPYAR